jgi:hypothetical protein
MTSSGGTSQTEPLHVAVERVAQLIQKARHEDFGSIQQLRLLTEAQGMLSRIEQHLTHPS